MYSKSAKTHNYNLVEKEYMKSLRELNELRKRYCCKLKSETNIYGVQLYFDKFPKSNSEKTFEYLLGLVTSKEAAASFLEPHTYYESPVQLKYRDTIEYYKSGGTSDKPLSLEDYYIQQKVEYDNQQKHNQVIAESIYMSDEQKELQERIAKITIPPDVPDSAYEIDFDFIDKIVEEEIEKKLKDGKAVNEIPI